VVLEVNENMPRTWGTNQIHISEVDAIVENTIPLVELPTIPVNEKDEAIAAISPIWLKTVPVFK
jgi:acyl-CoA hydrolase